MCDSCYGENSAAHSRTHSLIAPSQPAERLAEVVARLVEVFAQSVGKVLAEATARQPAARRVHLEGVEQEGEVVGLAFCLLYTSPSPRDS